MLSPWRIVQWTEIKVDETPAFCNAGKFIQDLPGFGKMFKRIAHVSLKTKDLQKSLEYYSKLGFTVQFMFTSEGADYGAYLKIGPGNFIEIFEDKTLETVVNNGIAHFCLETDSIDAVIEKLTALQVPFTPKKFGCDSSWQIWLADPDGNQFEVHHYTEKSMQLREGASVEIDW